MSDSPYVNDWMVAERIAYEKRLYAILADVEDIPEDSEPEFCHECRHYAPLCDCTTVNRHCIECGARIPDESHSRHCAARIPFHDNALRRMNAQRRRDFHRHTANRISSQLVAMAVWIHRWQDTAPDKSAGMRRAFFSCIPVWDMHKRAERTAQTEMDELS